MIVWPVRCLTLLSGIVLFVVLMLWPRSYFYSDKWWVKNTKPIPPPRMPRYTGWEPDRWSHGCAWLSSGGCLRIAHYDHLFAPGELKSETPPRPWRTIKFIPTLDSPFGFVLPYWCILVVAGIFPAIWLSRRRIWVELPKPSRFGTRHLLNTVTLTALGLAGFVQLGMGGTLLALEFALTLVAAIALMKLAWQDGPTKKYFGIALGIGLLCCSISLLIFYADCYKKYVSS